ncbi:CaiB/BaiF CoA transferase family protein [Actinophytocola sp.]|uniref:CaiB/BaiF CoA transferase family protein n=1 Tax=Actinophytocola sp. TaxID=1872138 RepID=UPI003D6C597E
MTDPLAGVVVVDFSRVLSGPLATMMLADLGAEVIKIERPGHGDDTRAWGPPYHGGDSTYFLAVNRGKRSAVLDLATERGRAAARALAARADVLVENFRPGTMDEFGLGHDELAGVNPRLVYCSLSGFGSGRGRDLPGYDFIVQAVGGLMSITGEPGGEPMKVGVALVDVLAGLHATIGVLAALRRREQTGRGAHVEINLLSSLLSSLVNQASAYLCTGQPPVALGNAHPSIVPYELLHAADRPIALGVGTDAQFAALCAALDRPDLAADDRFRTNSARVANHERLITELDRAIRPLAAEEVLGRLRDAGIPAGPVNGVDEAFALADRLGLRPVREVGDGEGTVPQVASPFRLDGVSPASTRRPPGLGEHTEEILAWLRIAEAPPA